MEVSDSTELPEVDRVQSRGMNGLVMAKILIVDDDVSLSTTVKARLLLDKFEVAVAHSASDGFKLLAESNYDIILLDWQMPEMSGIEFLRKYRASKGASYVILLTVLSNSGNKITGLNAGADDYLPKPFNVNELIARVNAVLRRPIICQDKALKAGDLSLDPNSRLVTVAGKQTHLNPLEFALLEFLMRNPHQVITPEVLLKQVWDPSQQVSTNSVYTCMNRLRKKLNQSGDDAIIKTVHGVGYRFDP